jgi:23S rRNA (cytidine2498-2'-O)-methyltransferase
VPRLVFARQLLPAAGEVEAESIRSWAELLVDSVAGVLPDHQTWSLHVVPFREVAKGSRMGARAWHSRARRGLALEANPQVPASVGEKRCALIREAAVLSLQKRRRHLLRSLRQHDGLFVEDEALVQLLLVSNTRGFLSLAEAPLPAREQHWLSCFPGGEVPIAVDKQAPSRAFAKLVEAELRLGRRIRGSAARRQGYCRRPGGAAIRSAGA